ncbi:50S ribosomal protein L1 [Candidatus Berkelbacteria bacterium]|nr:50S ribosomal protein L1 [Candidatus Berkelbacteria bacterium]
MPRKKKEEAESPLEQERIAEVESEASTESDSLNVGGQLVDETQLDLAADERETDTQQARPAELSAVHTDTVVAKEASGDLPVIKETGNKPSPSFRQRSKKYAAALTKFDSKKIYSLEKALELAKETAYTKFDGSIELHVRLQLKKTKGESDSIRGLLTLPHGTGKKTRAVILTEELVDQIGRAKKTEFDVLIAPKALMPKVAKIAKILGPIGKMPSPKAGTVSDKPEEVFKSIQAGRIEYRADPHQIVHQVIGKTSWEASQLLENAKALLGTLAAYQLLSVTVSATMGPGIRVNLASL